MPFPSPPVGTWDQSQGQTVGQGGKKMSELPLTWKPETRMGKLKYVK